MYQKLRNKFQIGKREKFKTLNCHLIKDFLKVILNSTYQRAKFVKLNLFVNFKESDAAKKCVEELNEKKFPTEKEGEEEKDL